MLYNNPMYKFILLDLDETIWDFKAAEHKAFEETMLEHGIPVTPEIAAFYNVTNQGLWKALERKEVTKDELKCVRFERTYNKALELFKDASLPPLGPDTGKVINQTYMERLSHLGIMLDGAEDFLRSLSLLRKEKNFGVYFITNGTAITAHGRIAASGVDQYVDGAFISDDIGVEKPDVKFFNYVTNALNEGDSSAYLVIGDSLTSDIQGAENAGMDSILFAYYGKFPEGHESHNITYRATSYDEILSIIDSNT